MSLKNLFVGHDKLIAETIKSWSRFLLALRMELLLSILSLGLLPLYNRHLAYYKIIEDFRNKLPREQNQAKMLSKEEKEKHPIYKHGMFQVMGVTNISPHKTSVSESDLDSFYNQLNNFDYSFILFKDYYKSYTRNLNRFNPKAENKNFDLVWLQMAIKEDNLTPLKPFPVLIYHFKYKYAYTALIYRNWKNFRNSKKKNKG